MPWIQIIFDAGEVDAQLLADLLSDQGAVAVTLEDDADQPLLEPPPGATPLWKHTRVIGLFAQDVRINRIVKSIGDSLHPTPMPAWRSENLEDKDWERQWMKDFNPLQFGQRLWICPSWLNPPNPQAINILMDPGLAFGTGTHASTALCLEWLEAKDLHRKTGIDYGCGSGILAIAALKLGAHSMCAVDIDPQARLSTGNNAEKNFVASSLSICEPENLPPAEVDFLIANILASPLIRLSSKFSQLVKPGGYLVLAGILNSQANDVMDAYLPWFTFTTPTRRQEWIRLEGQRKH
jgi:ribosomal protein L11 methyltransferase